MDAFGALPGAGCAQESVTSGGRLGGTASCSSAVDGYRQRRRIRLKPTQIQAVGWHHRCPCPDFGARYLC
jgi:hypothetical protein